MATLHQNPSRSMVTWRARLAYLGVGLMVAAAIIIPARLIAAGSGPPERISRADAMQLKADHLELQLAENQLAPTRARIKAVSAKWALIQGDKVDLDACDEATCPIVRARLQAAPAPDLGAEKPRPASK